MSDQYGAIPYGAFKEKYEVTNLTEDPMQVEDYMRAALKDVKPDAPIWASDQPLDTEPISNYQLEMRYEGKPDPWAPDLFLELTERDPRGTALEPNFRRVIEHAYERAQDLNLYPEAPENVPETIKTQEQLQVQKDAVFNEVKGRMRWFTTSKDNMMSGRNFRMAEDTALRDVTDKDATMAAIMTDEANPNLQNPWVTNLSNATPIGWERTTDHEFKVAQYGHVRAGKPMDTIEERKYHQAQESRKDTVVSADGQILTTGMAQLMKDVAAGQKARIGMQTGAPSTMPLQEIVPRDYVSTLSAEGQRQLQAETFKTGRTMTAFEDVARTLGAQKYDTKTMYNALGTTSLKENMVQAVRASKDKNPERRQRFTDAIQSGAKPDPALDINNRGTAHKANLDNRKNMLNSMQVKPRGMEEFSVAPLGSYKRPTGPQQLKSQRQTFAPVGGQSATSAHGRSRMGPVDSGEHHDADPTQKVEQFGERDSHLLLGTKYVRDQMEGDARSLGVNDRDNRLGA